ncbi:MAG: serine/threonine protein phosphatase [Clostridia bacterium]|nr:serine/threonine protein phosphatase [Clostridia bacterium]
MSLYAIADLHLSFENPKPMDIFGDNWKGHEEKIKRDWLDKVNEEDTVLIPGDFSWAMALKDTYKDFEYLNCLPGKKIMLKGNHDYYWNSLKKLNEFVKENNFQNIEFLHNNSYEVDGYIIAGTRGWIITDTKEDLKLINRELIRLELSIKEGIEKYGDKPIIICMHYPPTNKAILEYSDFIKLMQKYNVKKCVYGHLHGESHIEAVEGNVCGIEFKLVSADYLDFKLYKLV